MTATPEPQVRLIGYDDAQGRSVISRRRALAYGAMAVGGVAVGGSLLSACTSAATNGVINGTPVQGGTLKFGMYGAATNIMPVDGTTELARWITDPIVEALYKYDDNLESVPSLAAALPEVVLNADGTQTWTITLKQGVTFHNGDVFDSSHVVRSIQHGTDISTPSSWVTLLSGIFTEITPVDAYTVRLTTKTAQGILLSHLTNMPITHIDWLKKKQEVMGTGPFSLSPEDTQSGSKYVLRKYAGYHGTPVALDAIEVVVIPDSSARVVELTQGRINISTNVGADEAELLAKNPDITVVSTEAPVDILSYMNIGKVGSPFQSLDFRKAVAFGMDRKQVRDVVYGGNATIGQGPAGPGVIGYDPSLVIYPEETDFARAEQYLKASGVTNPSFTMTIANHPELVQIAQILQAGWRQIGITTTIDAVEGGPWIGAWLGGQYDYLMGVWQSGFATGESNLIVFTPAMSNNVLNPGYTNATVDTALKEVFATDDKNVRADQLKIAAAQLAQDTWIVPPVYPRMVVAQRKDTTPLNQNLMKVSRLSLPPLQMLG